tara:strand:+ start:176 stop:538 length:363 start_codon:yes stop_codon:yes gene_type:complete
MKDSQKIQKIKAVYDLISGFIKKEDLPGSRKPCKKTQDSPPHGFVFRNFDPKKLKSASAKIATQLKGTGYNFTFALSRNDDPMSTALGKNRLPLEVSYAYLGKDYRSVEDFDFETEGIVL